MAPQIKCPTCQMTASISDHKLLRPIESAKPNDVRRCYNCGGSVNVATSYQETSSTHGLQAV